MGLGVDRKVQVSFSKDKEKEFHKIYETLFNNAQEYDWVGGYCVEDTIEEKFENWRYICELEEDRFVVDEFLGEKEGDDKIFWDALAPIIDSDSYIESWREDHCDYIWKFKDGELEEEWE